MYASFNDAYAAAKATGGPSTIIVDNTFGDGQIGNGSGFSARIASLVGSTVTITGLTAMSAADVGRTLNIQYANSPGNIGLFPITAVLSNTSAQYTNPTADPNDLQNGSIGWVILDGFAASATGVSYLTFLTGMSGLTPSIVGQPLFTFNSGQPGNNGTFTVVAFASPTAVWVDNPGAIINDYLNWGTRGGSSASVSAFNGVDTATITGLSGMTAADVNQTLSITGAGDAGNNGAWSITAFIDATSVQIFNPSAVAPDSNNGVISWAASSPGNVYVTAASIPVEVIAGLTGITPSMVGNALLIQNGQPDSSYSLSGGAASITAFVNNTTVTLTGLTGITPFLVGLHIDVGNCLPGNNGTFIITSTSGTDTLTYSNQNGSAPDPANGSINWNIDVQQSNSVSAPIVGYITSTSVLWRNPSAVTPDGNNGSLWWNAGTNYDLSQITLAATGVGQFPATLNVNDGVTWNRGVRELNGVNVTTNFNYQAVLGLLGVTGTFPTLLCDQQGSFNVSGGNYIYDLSLANPGGMTVTLDHGGAVYNFVNLGANWNSGLQVSLYTNAIIDENLIQGAQGSVTITVQSPSAAFSNPPVQFNGFYGKAGGTANVQYVASANALTPFTGSGSFPTPNVGGGEVAAGPYNVQIGTMYFDQGTNAAYWWNGYAWTTYNGGGYITTANVLHATCSIAQASNLGAGDHVMFDTYLSAGFGPNITFDTSTPYTNAPNAPSVGRITLAASAPSPFGHLYKLVANPNNVQGSGVLYLQWYVYNSNAPGGVPVGNPSRFDDGALPGDFATHGDCVAYVSTRPGDGGQALVELRIVSNSGMTSIGVNSGTPIVPWLTIEQVY